MNFSLQNGERLNVVCWDYSILLFEWVFSKFKYLDLKTTYIYIYPPINKTDCRNITEILLKAALWPSPWIYINFVFFFLQEIRKQRATGRTKDGVPFPLSISVKRASEVEDDPRNVPPNNHDTGMLIKIILYLFYLNKQIALTG